MVIGDNLQKEMATPHPITKITTCKTNEKALKYSHLVKEKQRKYEQKGCAMTLDEFQKVLMITQAPTQYYLHIYTKTQLDENH